MKFPIVRDERTNWDHPFAAFLNVSVRQIGARFGLYPNRSVRHKSEDSVKKRNPHERFADRQVPGSRSAVPGNELRLFGVVRDSLSSHCKFIEVCHAVRLRPQAGLAGFFERLVFRLEEPFAIEKNNELIAVKIDF